MSITTASDQRPLLLRNRNFALVWVGQVLSQSGSKAYLINLLWWILDHAKTESEAATLSGALLILTALPGILLMAPIGRFIGRYPSKYLLVGGEACAGLLVGVILLLLQLDSLSIVSLFVLSFAIATCQAVVDPTLTNAVSQLVPEEDVEGAVGLEASTQSLAYFVGTGLGATLTGLFGLKAALLLNIGSYIVSACASAMARFAAPVPMVEVETVADGTQQSAVAPSSSSFQAMGLTALMGSFAAANFFMFPLFLVLPIFTKQVLQGSITQLGLLEACFWLGLISGALASARMFQQLSVHKTTGRLFCLFGVLLIGVWAFPNAYWTAAVLFVGGTSAGLINVKMITHFQRVVPDADKGRFFAQLQGFVTSSQPLGYFAFTLFLAKISATNAFALEGCGLLLVGIICLRLKRGVNL